MNSYLLFAGDDYYPAGGWEDFIGAYPSETEARAATTPDHDWAHIVHNAEVITEFSVSYRDHPEHYAAQLYNGWTTPPPG